MLSHNTEIIIKLLCFPLFHISSFLFFRKHFRRWRLIRLIYSKHRFANAICCLMLLQWLLLLLFWLFSLLLLTIISHFVRQANKSHAATTTTLQEQSFFWTFQLEHASETDHPPTTATLRITTTTTIATMQMQYKEYNTKSATQKSVSESERATVRLHDRHN